jgi:hypothetical protein
VRQAQKALRAASVPGPYMMILHQNQFSEFLEDLDTRGSHIQFIPATTELQILRGPGFQGYWDGIEIFTTSRVNTASSNHEGILFGRGAIGYKEEMSMPGPGADVVLQAGPLHVEIDRQARESLSGLVGVYRVGVSNRELARGRRLISKA